MTTPNESIISEEVANEIEKLYESATEHSCTCYSDPEGSCAACSAWTKATRESVKLINASTARLREDIAVIDQLNASFFEALKLLKLTAMNVQNPGQHVVDVIKERDRLLEQLQTIRDLCEEIRKSETRLQELARIRDDQIGHLLVERDTLALHLESEQNANRANVKVIAELREELITRGMEIAAERERVELLKHENDTLRQRNEELKQALLYANDAAEKGEDGRALGTAFEECQKENEELKAELKRWHIAASPVEG